MSVWLQDLRGFDGENANPAVQALYVEGFSEASGVPLEHGEDGNGRVTLKGILKPYTWLANLNLYIIYHDYIIKLQYIFCFLGKCSFSFNWWNWTRLEGSANCTAVKLECRMCFCISINIFGFKVCLCMLEMSPFGMRLLSLLLFFSMT